MAEPDDAFNVAFTAESIASKSVGGAAATFAAQGVRFVFQVVSQVILARLLDPAAFGLVAMAAPVIGFIQVLNDLGFAQAIVQRGSITRRQVSAMFWISAAIGALLSAVAAISAPLTAWVFGEPRLTAVVAALAGLILVSSLAVLPSALLNRRLRFDLLAIIDIGCVIAGVVAGIAAAWCGLGYWSLVIMQAAGSVSGLLLVWYFSGWRPSRPSYDPSVRPLVRFGANLMGSNLASYFSMTADNFLIGAVNGAVALGFYDRSYNLVIKPLGQLFAPVGRVAIPALARLRDWPDRYRSAYARMAQAVCIGCVPGMLFSIFNAKAVILLLFGAPWIAAAPVFAWISFGGVAAPLYSTMAWLFVTQDRTQEQMMFSTATAVLSVISFAIGVFWGVVGVAMLAACCFVFIQLPLMTWGATRSGPVSLRDVTRAVFPLLGGVAASAAVLSWLAEDGAVGVERLVPIFVASYAAFLLGVGCMPGGIPLFRNITDLRFYLRPKRSSAE
ncbi:MAG: lipopolysaccharide biosynthesis protein [Acetobacteraceae bacterium]|nr:lipopolysaccharide biosynthesis protein [Acetobacteraceae bacterium]